jgi:hypothetical protein
MESTIAKPTYKMSQEKKDQFVGILLLNYVINEGGTLPTLMQGDFKSLDSVVTKLIGKNYLQVFGSKIVPTEKGENVLKNFMNRYLEYLKVYDVYCAVDTEGGEFAFERYYDLSDEDFSQFVKEDRFEDVRIAVAEFKGIDPMEIVFMSFINEGRFNFVDRGWQFDIYSGLIWGQIEEICNGSLSVAELNGDFPEVTENIVKRGAEVAVQLLKIEDERKQEEESQRREQEEQEQTEVVEEETVVTEYSPDYYYQPYSYYETYYNPFYVSPIWTIPLLILI